MIKKWGVVFFALLLSGCSSFKVAPLDRSTGYFPVEKSLSAVKSVDVDLDRKKALVLVPNDNFTNEMIKNIGYFNQVVNMNDLQKMIVKKNLSEQIPSISDQISLSNASKKMGGFLWLHWHSRTEGTTEYQQLILTDASTLDDIFVTETVVDRLWVGVNDQNTWYPALNALITYIKKNSKTYGK